MYNISNWDWETGKKVVVDSLNCPLLFVWREEPQVSPDGEKFATIINAGDYQFSVCENAANWEHSYEKVWGLAYAPDGRLTALVMIDGLWTVCVDGQPWNSHFDYVWDTRFSQQGGTIAAAVQKDMGYGMCVNDVTWPKLYANAGQFALSPCGSYSCAVVQTKPLGQADINMFQQGCYSIAVNGRAWPLDFVSAWTPVFHPHKASVAAQCRTSIHEYTIAVDGQVWPKTFSSVWRPAFNPLNASVMAPVRQGKYWALAMDGEIVFNPGFFQIWHLTFSPLGNNWAVVACPEFGRWTVAVNGEPWKVRFSSMVSDPVFCPEGRRIAALGKNRDQWHIVVDDHIWQDSYDMAWPPVFSHDGLHVAAKVEKNGKYFISVNDNIYPQEFDFLCSPVFSPDSSKILLKGTVGHEYIRIVDDIQK